MLIHQNSDMSHLFDTDLTVEWTYEGLDLSPAYAVPMPRQMIGPLKIFVDDNFLQKHNFSRNEFVNILKACTLTQETTYSSGRDETQINILVAKPRKGSDYRWPVRVKKTNLVKEGYLRKLC